MSAAIDDVPRTASLNIRRHEGTPPGRVPCFTRYSASAVSVSVRAPARSESMRAESLARRLSV